MAMTRFSPTISYTLILLCAGFNISILAYDGSLINNLNMIPSYIEHFKLDNSLIGLNSAIINAGCIAASPLVSLIVDRWGRKAGLAAGSFLIILGAILQASAAAEAQFVIGRFFVGMASEINGAIAPTYVMEMASPKMRGILGNTVMVMVPVAAFAVGGIILGVYDIDSNWAWRGPILVQMVPSIFCLALLPFVDESPRWLVSKGRLNEAFEILVHLHGNGVRDDPAVKAEFAEMRTTIDADKQRGTEGGWLTLITPASNLRRFAICVLTNVFYQIVGGNMILYFSSYIIISAGITETRKTLLVNLGLLIWNIAATAIGAFTIEKFGRKTSLIWGTTLMSVCFAILSGLVYGADATGNASFGVGAILIVAVFLLGASCSWMILAYTYPPEVLRYSQRAKGVSTGQAAGYLVGFINLYMTPTAIEKLSWKYYAMNGAWNIVILVIIIWLFVETKGKSLEEIDEIFEGKGYKRVQEGEALGGFISTEELPLRQRREISRTRSEESDGKKAGSDVESMDTDYRRQLGSDEESTNTEYRMRALGNESLASVDTEYRRRMMGMEDEDL
ncbi:uncharacterized protein K452DRAFT_281337 [Aplosporella prunicola CBS 121167]|uniref:Major facilitator superfamily (MFS) profile domain-containing protein n=1 Tax=Aplosporella prunicola CBS 121167 TaxID=1176127 RepID=A0A6A6AU92_9PEZI|nr:uncharacterized protein K452DRAFT_281337 [Aplosporella prunicola CBS 121167]KAF2135572.1 hypothetical protein K452DRAFT_281337 [Aplosporella prunicola CBS 121167]